MRSRNQQRLDTLRFLKSAINRVEIDRRVTLDDAGVTEVVVRQVKDRRDSIRMFEEGNRTDLVAKETADLVIPGGIPSPQMGEEEITVLVRDVIQQVGAETIRDKGKVMGRLMPQVQGKGRRPAGQCYCYEHPGIERLGPIPSFSNRLGTLTIPFILLTSY